MRKFQNQKNIAICMGINDYYERGITRGVIRYAKSLDSWQLFGYGWMFTGVRDLRNWRGDGIIARVETREDLDILSAVNIPVVDVAGAYTASGFLEVTNDDFETGRKAAGFLSSRGFTNFAFCGFQGVGWSAERLKGFTSRLREDDGSPGAEIPVFSRPLRWWEQLEHSDDLYSWLSELPKPLALFACNDTAGVKTSIICRELGIQVPDETAILGVDNEDILCELADPSLSSIQLNLEEIGYKAAGLLDTVMKTGVPRQESITVSPDKIIERDSTDTFVCADRCVALGMRFIRAHAARAISVEDVADAAMASRRSLELKFRKYLDTTVYTAIQDARISAATSLLVSSDKTVETVAKECGFKTVQRFYTVFKNLTGASPGMYRKTRGRPA